MGMDFTTIIHVRQHFGNTEAYLKDVEPGLPFVGATKDFPFDCPKIDPEATAVILFQSRDVDHSKNVIQINPESAEQPAIFGGIPVSPSKATWNGNVMLVHAKVLLETNNILHIESRNSAGGSVGDLDDFIIDNLVVLYHVKEPQPSSPTMYNTLADALNASDQVGDFVQTMEFKSGTQLGGAQYEIVGSEPEFFVGTLNHSKTDGSGNYLRIINFDGEITKAGAADDGKDYSQAIEDCSAQGIAVKVNITVKAESSINLQNSITGSGRIYGAFNTLFRTYLDDITISDMEIESTLGSGINSSALIEAENCNRLTVKGCKLTNVRIRHRNTELAEHQEFRFQNNKVIADFTSFDFMTSQLDVVTVRGINGVWIEDNKIEVTNVHRVFKIADTEGNEHPEGNELPDQVSQFNSKNIHVIGNVITGSTGSNKQVLDMFFGSQNVHIEDNTVDVTGFSSIFENKTGIKQDFVQNTKIVNNPILRNDGVVIRLQGSYGALTAAHQGGYQNALISGNTLINTADPSTTKIDICDLRFYNKIEFNDNEILDNDTGKKRVNISGNEIFIAIGNHIPHGSFLFNKATNNSAGDPFDPDIKKIMINSNIFKNGLEKLEGQIAIKSFTASDLDVTVVGNQLDSSEPSESVSGADVLRGAVVLRDVNLNSIVISGNTCTMVEPIDERLLITGTSSINIVEDTGNTWNQNGFTDIALNDIASQINVYGKYEGLMVYNTTHNKPLYAQGSAVGDTWNDAASAVVNTPVDHD